MTPPDHPLLGLPCPGIAIGPEPDAAFPECAFLDAGRAVREAMLGGRP